MRKGFLLGLLALLLSIFGANATPKLRFGSDGTFKIAQFTDIHMRERLNAPEAAAVYEGMDYVIRTERPDLVVLSGDVITIRPAAPEWHKMVDFLDAHKTPWIVVFGNHDAEQDLSRSEMSGIIASGRYSLNTLNESGELADVELEVLSADGSRGEFYVFGMDSHDYNYLLGERSYDWFREGQIQWLRDCCTRRTAPDGTVAPSLAFFHIPLREYRDAWALEDLDTEAGRGAMTCGIRGERINSGALNSGMFAAMRETRSVIGVSVGHDHDNDFNALYQGIGLCYGRYSGDNTVHTHLPPGAKIFRVQAGDRGFETWVREYSGRIVHHCYINEHQLIEAVRHDRALPFGIWDDIDKK